MTSLEQRKRQLSANMPKTLLNVSHSTGTKPQVTLNTSQVMTAKNAATSSTFKQRSSIGVPHTTKSLLMKPPIGGTLAQRKKSFGMQQPSDIKTDQSRSYRSAAGGSSNHTRAKSAERTTAAMTSTRTKGGGLISTKNKSTAVSNPCSSIVINCLCFPLVAKDKFQV